MINNSNHESDQSLNSEFQAEQASSCHRFLSAFTLFSYNAGIPVRENVKIYKHVTICTVLVSLSLIVLMLLAILNKMADVGSKPLMNIMFDAPNDIEEVSFLPFIDDIPIYYDIRISDLPSVDLLEERVKSRLGSQSDDPEKLEELLCKGILAWIAKSESHASSTDYPIFGC